LDSVLDSDKNTREGARYDEDHCHDSRRTVHHIGC
jgi:hypothetical protein